RVRVGNREHGNFRDGLNLIEGNEFYAGFGADAGGLRIAGVDGHVHDAAALRAVGGTHGAVGEGVAGGVAIVFGVGVDDAAECAVFGCNFGLDASPCFSIASNDNGSFDGNAHGVELLVIRGCAVVDVDEGSGDIAVF